MKTLTKALAGSVAAVTLSLGLAGTASATPAGERAPSDNWNIQATGGYTTGTAVFHNRSVQFTGGYVKSNTTGCVRVHLHVPQTGDYYINDARTACGRGPDSGKNFGFTLPADYPGGANHVVVTLHRVNADDSTGPQIGSETVYKPQPVR
ncbi:hypothetical protein AB0G74_29430 [Streptomyces sp. NPDC020875]|uniref:hypothetical protein n=1 Tax=Streptomyces sp. NPDC020875 TaxID=3154898 RepID=UPI0033D5C3EC